MNTPVTDTPTETKKGRKYLLLWAVIIGIGISGEAIKMPFGVYMLHLLHIRVPHQTFLQHLTSSEWGWLFWAALGTLFFFRRSQLPVAPLLRRWLYRDSGSPKASSILKPAVIAGLVCTVFFIIAQAVGLQAPILTALGHIPHASRDKLFTLYPLADVGAALSEETIYRFGIITTLMGIMALLHIGGRKANNNIAFWIANILQGLFFGFIHVSQGAVTSQVGGIPLQTLISPPTWTGFVLGFVYRTWGFEAAIVAHMAGDILVPIFWAIWVGLAHLL